MADKKADAKDTPTTESKPDLESKFERLLLTFIEQGQRNQFTPEMLGAVLEKVGLSTAEGMQRAITPENKRHLELSAFFTAADKAKYGDHTQKPKLIRTVFFNHHPEREDQLMPSEIEAYNSINEDLEARNGQYTAIIKARGRKKEELHVNVPVAHLDHRMNLPPSLLLLIHELKTGQQVQDMQLLLDEIADLRQRLSNYEAVPTSPAGAAGAARQGLVSGGPLVKDLQAGLDATPVGQLTAP